MQKIFKIEWNSEQHMSSGTLRGVLEKRWQHQSIEFKVTEITQSLSVIKKIVDKVKVEGMLHILPEDRDKLAKAIREEVLHCVT